MPIEIGVWHLTKWLYFKGPMLILGLTETQHTDFLKPLIFRAFLDESVPISIYLILKNIVARKMHISIVANLMKLNKLLPPTLLQTYTAIAFDYLPSVPLVFF